MCAAPTAAIMATVSAFAKVSVVVDVDIGSGKKASLIFFVVLRIATRLGGTAPTATGTKGVG